MNDIAAIADQDANEAVARAERAAATFAQVRDGVAKIIFGQDDVIEQTLVTLLANPRTQSALLQAMQERELTVAGTQYDLPQPFHVLATQNPLEQEGTYP